MAHGSNIEVGGLTKYYTVEGQLAKKRDGVRIQTSLKTHK